MQFTVATQLASAMLQMCYFSIKCISSLTQCICFTITAVMHWLLSGKSTVFSARDLGQKIYVLNYAFYLDIRQYDSEVCTLQTMATFNEI